MSTPYNRQSTLSMAPTPNAGLANLVTLSATVLTCLIKALSAPVPSPALSKEIPTSPTQALRFQAATHHKLVPKTPQSRPPVQATKHLLFRLQPLLHLLVARLPLLPSPVLLQLVGLRPPLPLLEVPLLPTMILPRRTPPSPRPTHRQHLRPLVPPRHLVPIPLARAPTLFPRPLKCRDRSGCTKAATAISTLTAPSVPFPMEVLRALAKPQIHVPSPARRKDIRLRGSSSGGNAFAEIP